MSSLPTRPVIIDRARTYLNNSIQAAFGKYATFECKDVSEVCRDPYGRLVQVWRWTIIVNKKFTLANVIDVDREAGQNKACTSAIYELDRQYPNLGILQRIAQIESAAVARR